MFTETVAVVGGTGFLGRHVVSALENAGYRTRALSRRSGFDALNPDPETLRGCAAVVNMAGIKREQGGQTFRAIHVTLVERVIAAMRQVGVRRLVHISVVVARPSANLPYHDTKWKGEQVIRSSGLDWTILRPGVIYGEGDDMLAHLTLMIRTASIFPIVGSGAAPMRPVDARDVAAAVVASLRTPASAGQTHDVVGPDRLTLRDVVRRVSEAMRLPLSIWSTPVAVMRLPVWIMEKTMRQPLSTRAQLAMLEGGLDGDPEPARRTLNLKTQAFTVEHIRPLLPATNRVLGFNLRLLSAPRPKAETSPGLFALLLALLLVSISVVFGFVADIWMGLTLAMGASLLVALASKPARRFKPSLFNTATGIGAGLVLYGLTRAVVALLPAIWPEWESGAEALYLWQRGHSWAFLAPTLVMIVIAEEVAWRGVVARFFMERWGRAWGIVAAAAVYAVAHWAAFNPLLMLAAFGCGIFWGWLYAATDDLVAPTVSHLLWDTLLLSFPLVRSVG